ncbi:MAG TPA: GNAT family N-acetyltransferase [Propionibacteriaceae bacterium]
MFDLTVRVLGQEDWPVYRAVRLAALQESPNVLGATLELEASADEDHWRAQMITARRLVVELDERVCGVVSVDRFTEEPESADLFGLWVDPSARSTGAAGRLVETAVTLTAAEGIKRMYYWVGTENARAIGFATGFGFRVTSHRRAVVGAGDPSAADTEIALVLPLEDDPATVPNATAGGLGRPDPGSS